MTELLDQTEAGAMAQEVYTFPLSFAQQGLWLLSQLQLQNPAYHIPIAYDLRGPLRVDVLERSLDEIMARHEVLRTTFAVLDGEPAQVVAPHQPAGLEVVDLSHLSATERAETAERLKAEEARRPFDPARGPLFRTTLVRLEAEHHLLLCTAHHLVFDGWSEGILLRELSALYRAFAAGADSPLPELEVQYGDYAHWEREWLRSDDAAARLAYWREHLLDAPDAAPLPTDRPHPDEPSHAGGYHSFTIEAEVAARLAAAARAEGATPTAAVLAAFAVLLRALAGEDRVLVGSPVANRGQVELEGLIGFLVDALVLKVDVSGDAPFRELVRRSASTLYAAHENALPFALLVETLRPPRDPGRSAYFQVLFNFDTASPGGRAELAPGLEITPRAVATGSPQFDLVLSLQDTGAGMRGTLAYATDLFDASTAARLVGQLKTVLARAAEDPSRRARELLLDEDGRRRVVAEWNATARGYDDGGRTLHELVAAQARRTPGAVAVEGEDEALTYAELDARSGRLARRLRDAGVGPESVVAIHLDRSPEMVVAALAALRAGGAYLPVDPSYPTDRRSLMLEDAGARALVTTGAHLESLPLPAGVAVVRVDEDEGDAGESLADEGAGDPDRLAYVIYTSGSTGRPKGAMNEHRAVVNRLLWMQEAYGMSADDAVLQKTPFSFDVSVWELFWPLLTGARLVLARPEGHRDPEYLRDRIRERGVTTLHFVPSMLRAFLEAEGVEACAATLRRVVCSGEALTPDLQERFFARLPGVELHNLYGPTECAVDVTAHACVHDPEARAVPIGRPVANTAAYVLDARGNPVPPGFPGELCIGGAQVGRGYLGRPGLTAERFVPDPFGPAGGRLYRTGDLARHGDDGVLEYLGRIDQQVKVRGFRIELGEIEAALREHPGVASAAVVARSGDGGATRLVAYVAGAEPAPSPAELRSHLASRLPEHMLPAAFVALDALPLTPSGKLDRRALPEPGAERAGVEEAYTAPRNVVEDTLAALWAGVLGIDQVGVHDNFFALGGDSILGLRIAALARERGLPATIRLLFRNPTVAGMSEAMEAERVGDDELHTEPFSLVTPEDRALLPEGVVDAYPLSRTQLGMLYHQESSDAPLYHGLTSFHVRVPLDEEKLDRAMRAAMERHPNLRTGFDLESYSEPLQVVYARSASPVAVHDLRALSDAAQRETLARFCKDEQDRRFDLPVPPQIRFHLHRRTDDTVQFTLVENHAVSDGWSLHTVIADVLAGYFALLRGDEPPELAPLRTTYRDFIHLERRALASEETRGFWRSRLEGFEPALLAPAAPAEARDGPRVRKVDRRLRRSLLEALRAVARREAVPLKSVLLTAHLRVLAHFTGSRDLATGLSTNGRPETVDGDRVAGLFLNTVPLRAELTGGTWRELIRQVHEAELALMPHRRYPLSAIQAEAGGRALFDASFVYLNFHVVGEHVRTGPMEVLGTSAVLEETDFTLMTSFQHLPGNTRVLGLCVEGDRRALGDARVEEIAECYLRVLRAIAADPSARHDTFSPLDVAEREALLGYAAGRGVDAPERPPHRAFAEHAARIPGHPCVESAEGVLTYGDVHRLSGRLAARLRALGVGPEARVALCLDRVPEIVPAVLAAFRAGAAYVPLDPGHPRDRLHALLRDSGAAAVVTLARWRDRVEGAGIPVLEMEDDGGPSMEGDDFVDAASLAYVIFTSGTTGRPKGVGVEHRQIMHYAAAAARFGPAAGGRWGLASTFTADLGNTVLFPALLAGGTLRVLSEAEATDPAALAAALEGRPLDVLKIVPSHLRALLSADRPERVLPRHALVLGGEAADWSLVERVRALVPGVRVFNHYGPTETTVGVLAGELDPGAPNRPAAPPLGRPLGRARVYLLGPDLHPVPAGARGELYVGGDSVARGYLGAPAPTAERFVPDPFAAEPGARMYRTGDRARLLADGRIEFLGRADDQVKIRGFRVEPGEAEAALRAHPAVAACAVAARRDEDEAELVAYVVPAPGERATDEALREFLARSLPAPAVPSRWVRLDALPLTPNGKLDRRALPAPGARGGDAAVVEPRTPVEETLVELWKTVLKIERLGVHDSFFALGGDSIRAILVAARVRKAFGIAFSVDNLLQAQTVAGVAEALETALGARGSEEPAAITPVPRDGDLPLSFSQQRFWYEHLLDTGSSGQNVPTVLRLKGSLDVPALVAALHEIERRHEVLRTRFPMVDGVPRQVIEPAGGLEPRRLDLVTTVSPEEREEALRAAALEEAWAPFDLERGPVIRALLVRTDEEDHTLVLTTHHIVTDGWSVGLLLRELSALYAAFREGRPSPLPALPVQYADYAHWQRARADGAVLEAQAAYWKAKLAGASSLELATDHPRAAVRSNRGGAEWHALSRELSEGLKETSRREGVTLFMALLAGYAVLLHHRSGAEDLVVGSPVATHRDREELQGVIGPFLNTLALRVDLAGDPDFRELLRRVRGTALEAFSNQELPFEKLVDVLEVKRDANQTPVFQVLFNHSIPGEKFRMDGLGLGSLNLGDPTTEFDLELTTEERGERLAALLRYRADLFEAATVRDLLAELESILGRMVRDPDLPLSELRASLEEDARARRGEARAARDEALRGGLRGARRKAITLPE